MTWAAILVALLGSGFLGATVTRISDRGKTKAEEKDILAQAAKTTFELMQATLERQEEELVDLRKRVRHLELEVARYRAQHGPLPPHTGV